MRRNWLLGVALLVALLGLILGITAGALWDPHEVRVAELSRRIGLNLLGGGRLALAAADNSVPIRADLGRGELPFTSAALGFRVFGLHAWAGRLPMLLWSLLGLGALFVALDRLWDRRCALYGALILGTTPLYFLQARALLGDAVTLASFSIAWSGLALACFSDVSPRGRAAFFLLGAAGLYAGFWCRGPLFSVAAPALAVGAAGLLQPSPTASARWAILGATVLGLLALALGLSGLWLARATGEYSVFVGSALISARELPTFESALGNLAHATYPWSAAAPLTLVLFGKNSKNSRENAPVHAALLALVFSLSACAGLSPLLGDVPLPGLCGLAVLLACALRRWETGQLGAPLLGLVVAAAGVVIGFDLRTHPEKALSGFGVDGLAMPEGLAAAAAKLWLAGAGWLALLSAACLFERERAPDEVTPSFDRAEYARVLRALQEAWDGNLVFAALLLEAALVGFLLLSAISERLVNLPQLDAFGSFSRKAVALGAIALPLLPLLVLSALAVRDLARTLFAGRPGTATRAQGFLLAFAALGGVASLGFYPELARQVSPTQAFERYRELGRRGEPLGLLGEQSGAAHYQGAPDARSFDDRELAFEWLLSAEATNRRWLVLRKAELASLNASYRERSRGNLPVLDARSSELLLASNVLRPGERDENPLSPFILERAPTLQHPLHAVLGEQLEVLGWSLLDDHAAFAPSLVPERSFRLAICFRVLAPVRGSWQVFVHLDGLQRRFNADHELLEGRYPARLWRPGDVLVDASEVRLEPNFSPSDYALYFGLFSGEQRMPVTTGPARDNRIVAGTLQVR